MQAANRRFGVDCCRGDAGGADVGTQIAALIAGAPHGRRAPAWLVAGLPTLVAMVRASRRARERDLGDMRDALDTVERAAGNLGNAPNDPAVMSHLAKADPTLSPSSWVEILAAAPRIAEQARLALTLASEDRDGGRRRVRAPGLRARMLCAAIVSEAWQAVRARREIPLSDEACRAADLLWRASGRASTGTAGAAERWRRSFERLTAAETAHPEAFDDIRAAITGQISRANRGEFRAEPSDTASA